MKPDLPEKIRRLRICYDNMLQRTSNPRCNVFKWYGRIGIGIAKQWLKSRSAFVIYGLQNGYEIGLDIARKDSRGNYTPKNCRWITHQQNLEERKNGLPFKRLYKKLPMNVFFDKLPQHKHRPYIVRFNRNCQRYEVGSFGTLAKAIKAKTKALKDYDRGKL